MERVYVGNLPPDIRIKDIDDFFRAFGKLVYIDVNHRANPVYALVQFDSARNAFNAVKARHGYDYEGYTLQLRLVENEVRKRRDATPPPPPPPMLSDFNSMNNNRGGFNNSNNNNTNNNSGNSNNNTNRMGGNFANSNSYQSSSNSQWSSNNRSGMSQGMQQQQQNNRVNMPQQNMMDYQTNNRSNNMQQQNMMMPPYSSNSGGGIGRSNMQQNTNSNRSNMQQNITSNRSNIQQQQFSNSNRSNVQQQQFSNSNRLNVQQQYSNTSNRSNMQQYSNSNRSNMPQQQLHQQQQNMNNYSNMSQQNMMNYSNSNYSNSNYSNMSQQQQNMNMMDYSNNSSWNSGNNNMMNNNMSWNSGNNMNNGGNNNYNSNNNNAPNNYIYNSNNDPYNRPGFEDSFTRGLSGSGRKWFNRYIRKGFSPEMARNKAMEHRTQPYQRDVNINNNNNTNSNAINPIPNDPTNVALETIGNTILSLLTTNPPDNFINNDNQMMQTFSNWGGDNFQAGFNNNIGNFDMPGPSSSRGNRMSQSPVRGQQPRNRVSRQQYLKSLDILKRLRGKREQTAKDRLSKKYHTQIVRDYEQYEKSMSSTSANSPRAPTTSSNPRNDRQIASLAADGKSYTQLSIALRKKKQQLFLAAKRFGNDAANKRFGGAYKKRIRILMNDCGFEELEAKSLALHPLERLEPLMALKAECDQALKKKQESFSVVKKITNKSSKIVAYRQDINFLKKFDKQRIENLSPRLKSAIRACLTRIHKFEKEAHKPLTKSKFVRLLPRKTGQKPTTSKGATTTSNAKKTPAGARKTKAATDTNKKVDASETKQNTKEDKATEKPQVNEKVNAASGSSDKQKPAEKKEN